MLSIGLDVHQNSTALCQLDSSGRRTRERVIRGGFAAVAEHLGKVRKPFNVCFEASCGYGTLHDLLRPMAHRVVVAHPTELKLIFRSKHKNDRNDARKIARLLHMGEVPAVHVPTIRVRAWRGLIEHRSRLVDKGTRCKNALRAQLRALGVKAPPRKALWSKKGLAWLNSQDLPTPLDRVKRTSLVAELSTLNQQIAIVEKELNAIADKDWRVILLRSIPGFGPRTSEAVAAYIDKPQRFGHIKSIGKYFGMVPSQDSSAGVNRLGHITREGPATVRKMITQAAWQAVRRSPRMKAFFERLTGGHKHRKAIALVAVGHKLLRIALAMLKSKDPWREDAALPVLPTSATDTPTVAGAENAVKPTSHARGAALPPSASANCIETKQPRRRGRGQGSSGVNRKLRRLPAPAAA